MAENCIQDLSKANKDVCESLTEKENLIVKCWKQTLTHKPKCNVFDLDFTLWPFCIDDQIAKVYKWKDTDNNSHTKILDHRNKPISHYQDITLIIKTLKQVCFEDKSFHLAIASRATFRDRAIDFFDVFGWAGYFDSVQIYSGTKTKHMKNIFNELKLKSFNEILFFDDNRSNLEETKRLGVIGHQVRRRYGLNTNELIKGLESYNSCNVDFNLISSFHKNQK